MNTIKVGMIGVGAISGIYLKNLTNMFKEIEIIGICDLIPELAKKAQEEYKIPKIYATHKDLLADKEVDIVLNLTRPLEHYDITKEALLAGKHVYSEKPLAATFELGLELVKLAKDKNLLLGGAPDTYLGAGIQTCRKLIEDDFIGDVIGGAAFMIGHGHETWHPDPEFYYQKAGGPMMDMGPYYVTAFVNLLGRISGVTGVAKKAFEQRTITSEPKFGKIIDVETPTHITGILDFENGATGTLITSFDVYYDQQARFEVYGTKGTLIVPDPNTFGGPIRLKRGTGDFKEMPLLFAYPENSRGLGLADMAKALQSGRRHRANDEQTLHVLEVLTAFEKSGEKKAYYPISSAYTRAQAMKNLPIDGILDS